MKIDDNVNEIEVEIDDLELAKFLVKRFGIKKFAKLVTYYCHVAADEDGLNSAQFKTGLAKWLHQTTGKVAKGFEWMFSETFSPVKLLQRLAGSMRDSRPGEYILLDDEIVDGLKEALYDFIAEHHPQALEYLNQQRARQARRSPDD